MRIQFYILTLLTIVFFVETANSQVLDKKEFKNAKTIRLYVNDSAKNEAVIRFANFINETGFTVSLPKTYDKEINSYQSGNSFKPEPIQLKPSLKSRQKGDTIMTNTVTLYDVMMGDFESRLEFYADKDNSDKLYIAVSGYVSNSAFGGNFSDLKMKKGGKGSNWAQRSLFKQLNKHVLSYPEVNLIMYSDK